MGLTGNFNRKDVYHVEAIFWLKFQQSFSINNINKLCFANFTKNETYSFKEIFTFQFFSGLYLLKNKMIKNDIHFPIWKTQLCQVFPPKSYKTNEIPSSL